MSKTNLDDLPAFEGKRERLIRIKANMWESNRGSEDYKHQRRLILGILHKYVGQPWTKVWRELQQKVKPVGFNSVADLVSRYVSYDTWLEGKEVWCHGALGPEPVSSSYSSRFHAYYVCPVKRIVMAAPKQPYQREFQIPEELPSKRPGEKYMRNGDTWFRVGFTQAQMDTMKRGESRLSNLKYRRYKNEPNLGAPLEARETRSLRLTHSTDHRGIPPQWRWRYYTAEWKQVLDRCIGGTIDDVLTGISTLPLIYKSSFGKETYNIGELLRYWIEDPDYSVPGVQWSPYVWHNNQLARNPRLDQHTETLVFTPTALQVGGKELVAIREQIEQLRHEHAQSI